jgi:hypothetical protein
MKRAPIRRRDMRADDFPAEVGEFDPHLGLAADEVLASDFKFQVNRGCVVTNRQDFQPDCFFFNAGAGLTGDTKGVDGIKTVAVFAHGEAHGERAVPKCVVENVYVLLNQRGLIGFKFLTDFLDNFGDVGGVVFHGWSSGNSNPNFTYQVHNFRAGQ